MMSGKRVITSTCQFLIVLLGMSIEASAQLGPWDALGQMGRGINLGNTMEPPTEGGWNNGPVLEYYFDDYVAAGFKTVRLPVRWEQHTQWDTPYAVDDSWMNRVEQVVDWALERDLFVILNAHHEDWLKQNYANASYRARFDSIWSQVATRFKDKSEKLLFEIINEPFGMTRSQVDDLNGRVLSIIRRTNPTRIVIYSGNQYSDLASMTAARIPDDQYLMAYFHSYDPWNFAGLAEGVWGSVSDRAAIAGIFQTAADWAAEKDIPVMISEFGAVRTCDYNSRMAHYGTYVEEAVRTGIAFQVWDDGGDFGVYERGSRNWSEVKDILMYSYPEGPTNLSAVVQNDSTVVLSWTNRTMQNNDIIIERAVNGGLFESITTIGRESVEYIDEDITAGATYLYRVRARFMRGEDMLSYPVRIDPPPFRRSSFLGMPFPVPGVIEAEDYDIGGEGLTYHDTDGINTPGAYRPSEAVDIEGRTDGGFHVAYIATGEWLEYTISVAQEAQYEIRAEVASLEGGGRFRYEFGSIFTRAVNVPKTNSWQTTESVSTVVPLQAGEYVMRVFVIASNPFNIDRFVVSQFPTLAVPEEDYDSSIHIYPNPTSETIRVKTPLDLFGGEYEVYNLGGQQVLRGRLTGLETEISLEGLAAGLHIVRFVDKKSRYVDKTVVKF